MSSHMANVRGRFAANIKRLLEQRQQIDPDLTDAAFARAVGRGPSWISAVLSGERNVGIDNADAVADFFGVDPKVLFTEYAEDIGIPADSLDTKNKGEPTGESRGKTSAHKTVREPPNADVASPDRPETRLLRQQAAFAWLQRQIANVVSDLTDISGDATDYAAGTKRIPAGKGATRASRSHRAGRGPAAS